MVEVELKGSVSTQITSLFYLIHKLLLHFVY